MALLLWGRIRRQPLSWLRLTERSTCSAGCCSSSCSPGGILRGTYAAIPVDLDQGQGRLDEPSNAADPATPDIYILMLDGYPRADSVTRLFGDDNRPFLDALEDRGFEVAENSQSNYMFTAAHADLDAAHVGDPGHRGAAARGGRYCGREPAHAHHAQ